MARLSRAAIERWRDGGPPPRRSSRLLYTIGFSLSPDQWGNDVTQAAQSVAAAASAAAQWVAKGAAAGSLGLFIAGPAGELVGAALSAIDDLTGGNLSQSAIDLANMMGISQVNVVYTFWTDASKGQVDFHALAGALAQDYANDKKALGAVDALLDGDYTKTWNILTDNGALWGQLSAYEQGLIPQPSANPQFDIVALGKQQQAGTIDDQDAAAQAFAHGYYLQGYAWLGQYRAGLASSPLGGTLAAGKAKASGDPATMLLQAKSLRFEATNPNVVATWKTHLWGSPSSTFLPLAADLTSTANAILAARYAAAHKVTTIPYVAPAPQRIVISYTPPAAAAPVPAASLMAAAKAPPAAGSSTSSSTPATSTSLSTPAVVAISAGVGGAALLALHLLARVRSNPRRRRRRRA